MAEASLVLTDVGTCRAFHRRGEDKVRVEFGSTVIFLTPADAREVGAQLIAAAANANSAIVAELDKNDGDTDLAAAGEHDWRL